MQNQEKRLNLLGSRNQQSVKCLKRHVEVASGALVEDYNKKKERKKSAEGAVTHGYVSRSKTPDILTTIGRYLNRPKSS